LWGVADSGAPALSRHRFLVTGQVTIKHIGRAAARATKASTKRSPQSIVGVVNAWTSRARTHCKNRHRDLRVYGQTIGSVKPPPRPGVTDPRFANVSVHRGIRAGRTATAGGRAGRRQKPGFQQAAACASLAVLRRSCREIGAVERLVSRGGPQVRDHDIVLDGGLQQAATETRDGSGGMGWAPFRPGIFSPQGGARDLSVTCSPRAHPSTDSPCLSRGPARNPPGIIQRAFGESARSNIELDQEAERLARLRRTRSRLAALGRQPSFSHGYVKATKLSYGG